MVDLCFICFLFVTIAGPRLFKDKKVSTLNSNEEKQQKICPKWGQILLSNMFWSNLHYNYLYICISIYEDESQLSSRWLLQFHLHLSIKSMDFQVRFRIMARLKNVTFVKGLGILLRTVPSGENVWDVVRLVTFTVFAAMNLLQQLPLVHVSCRLILRTTELVRLWNLIL